MALHKFIIISDTHLLAKEQTLHGLDPRARLDACIRDINAHHSDADFCILPGDLADDGAEKSYDNLRQALSSLQIPYHLMVGNHDNRKRFTSAFPDAPTDNNGFVQSRFNTPAGLFVLLDTVQSGLANGSYCAERAAWLRQVLADTGEQPVYIFMHHPPFKIGMPALDRIRILDADILQRSLSTSRSIRHLFMGHVHRTVSGSWLGWPYTIVPGTNHQVVLDMVHDDPIYYSHNHPGYGVVLIDEERVIVHTQDPLEETKSESNRRTVGELRK